MDSWQPDQNVLSNLVNIFALGRQPDKQQDWLTEFKTREDYILYMTYVFSLTELADTEIRLMAGFQLKIASQRFHKLGIDLQLYIESSLLKTLFENIALIRQTTATIISTIISRIAFYQWTDLANILYQSACDSNQIVVETSLDTQYKIMEDRPNAFSEEGNGNILSTFLPIWINNMVNTIGNIGKYSMLLLESLLEGEEYDEIIPFLPSYIQNLNTVGQSAANSNNELILSLVCNSLNLLFSHYSDKLADGFENTINFMMVMMQHQSEIVAIRATEFWSNINEMQYDSNILIPKLDGIIKILVTNLKYSEESDIYLSCYESNDIPDKKEDINPSKKSFSSGEISSDDISEEWNKRVVSSRALESLSLEHSNHVLRILDPLIAQLLTSTNELLIETGILSLGVIALGCNTENFIKLHIQDLFNYCSRDKHPLIRSITMWTLTKYLGLISSDYMYLTPFIEILCQNAEDPIKIVEEMSLSSLSITIETVGEVIENYADVIINKISNLFSYYQLKNYCALLDTITCLFQKCSSEKLKSHYLQLGKPVIDKYLSLTEPDTLYFYVCDCMAEMLPIYVEEYSQYIPQIFSNSLQLLDYYVIMKSSAENEQEIDYQVVDGENTGLQFIGSIITDYTEHGRVLFSQTPALLNHIITNMITSELSVEQTINGLIGDIAINYFDYIKPKIDFILSTLSNELCIPTEEDIDKLVYLNNAIWAIGEIIKQLEYDSKPYIELLLKRLLGLCSICDTVDSIKENIIVTISRIGILYHNDIMNAKFINMNDYFPFWCKTAVKMSDGYEKDDTFKGMCLLLSHDFSIVLSNLKDFCLALCSWEETPMKELNDMILELLTACSQSNPVLFSQNYQQIAGCYRVMLRERLDTDIVQRVRQKSYCVITFASFVLTSVILVCFYVITNPLVTHVILLYNLKKIVIYVILTICLMIVIKIFFWRWIEMKLFNVVARRELMHLYLGSKEYYTQKARYLYVNRLKGFVTPQLKSPFQRFCYYIGWYPIGDLFHFTEDYAQKRFKLKSDNKKTLVLDLDETIVTSVMKERARNDENYDEEISIISDNKYIHFYVYYRPFLKEFLSIVKKWYRIVIYTASKEAYAQPIVKKLNYKFDDCIKGLFSQDFLKHGTKDLTKIREDLSKVVFIDNNVNNFTLQPNNGILIRSWYNNNSSDQELKNLLPLLEALSVVDDVTKILTVDQKSE